MNGFFNVLKPPGMTSSQVVGFVRRLIDGEKAGHAGTLDPQAAGILPVMAGKAARLFDYLVDKQKAYVAEIAFGAATDTQDAQGKVMEWGEQYPTVAQVQAILPKFMGQVMQAPPSYSAIKQNGQRLYDLARKGELVQTCRLPKRRGVCKNVFCPWTCRSSICPLAMCRKALPLFAETEVRCPFLHFLTY